MGTYYKIVYLFFLFGLNNYSKCDAQVGWPDTTPIKNVTRTININNNKAESIIWTDVYKIERANIDFGVGAGSFYSLFVKTNNIKSRLLKKENQDKNNFQINSCNINFNNSFLLDEYKTKLYANSIWLSNCYFSRGADVLNFQSNFFRIYKCCLPYLGFIYTSGDVEITNVILQDLYFRNFKGDINTQSISAKSDSLSVSIYNSNIQLKMFNVYKAKNSVFHFLKDTLNDGFDVSVFDSLSKNTIYFDDCLINCPLYIFGNNYENTHCIFKNCQFGPRASINNYAGKYIEFDNCRNFETQLKISGDFFINNEKPIYLTFNNTDLSKLDFPYLGSMKIKLNVEGTDEDDISNYETLLNKYKSEGKVSSYKNLKIEYEKYQYFRQGFWGRFTNFLVQKWWNYGFDRGRIFIWTLIFIAIFFVGNSIARNNVNKLYPIYGGETINYHRKYVNKFNFYWNEIWRILIITLIIFFTFRIDLHSLFKFKLKFIFWILFQYVLGLWCLFFIFNFVIKL